MTICNYLLVLCCSLVASEELDEFEPVIIENANFIEYTNFSHVDSSYFQHVLGVSIESSNLTHIPRRFLGELHKLTELTLKKNTIKNFGIKSLDYYFATKLKKLTIQKQHIGPLSNNSFIRMRNLTYLALICTSPSRIESNAFNGLAKLDTLDLSGNNLTTIAVELLEPLKKLRVLILNNNNFAKFSSLPKLDNLETIYLENNPIRNVAAVDRIQLRKMAPKLTHVKFCTEISVSCEPFEPKC